MAWNHLKSLIQGLNVTYVLGKRKKKREKMIAEGAAVF